MGRWRPAYVPRRRDLGERVPLHADPDLFASIHDGIAGTAMAPFGGQMTAEEIRHTIDYLEDLGAVMPCP